MKAFFTDDIKKRVGEAVKAIEAQTSAEIVVAVRAKSAEYRSIDLLVGGAFAFVVLNLLLFLPQEFDERFFGIEVLATFLVAVFFTANVYPLKRLLLSKTRTQHEVRAGAAKYFMDQRLGRTKDRTAVLVYISLFECRAEVVHDTGIDAKKVGAALTAWQEKMQSTLQGSDASAFLAALTSIGGGLGAEYPRQADDTNELADEVDG
jgi:putative membrane protein